jgi:hypothetical protein
MADSGSSGLMQVAKSASAGASEPQDLLLATLPASQAQRRLALFVVCFLLAAFFITAPFASVPLEYVGAFVPTYANAMFVVDVITSDGRLWASAGRHSGSVSQFALPAGG